MWYQVKFLHGHFSYRERNSETDRFRSVLKVDSSQSLVLGWLLHHQALREFWKPSTACNHQIGDWRADIFVAGVVSIFPKSRNDRFVVIRLGGIFPGERKKIRSGFTSGFRQSVFANRWNLDLCGEGLLRLSLQSFRLYLGYSIGDCWNRPVFDYQMVAEPC